MILQDCCFNLARDHKKICWIATRSCNRSCSFCAMHAHANHGGKGVLIPPVALDRVATFALANDITRVIISGGEPLLAANLPTAVRRLSSSGLTVSLATNGVLLGRDRLATLLESGLDKVCIGIDAASLPILSTRGDPSYAVGMAHAWQNIHQCGIPHEANLLLAPRLHRNVDALAYYLSSCGIEDLNLIMPQQCGRFVTTPDSRLANAISLAQAFQLVEALRKRARTLRPRVIDAKCKEDSCPSERLVWGADPSGHVSACPWKWYLAIRPPASEASEGALPGRDSSALEHLTALPQRCG